MSAVQTKSALPTVPEWTFVENIQLGNSIKRTFAFNNFREAFLFMSGGAQLAEKNQHHPDWRNLYNTVDVTLTTDDKACLSTFDIELAQGLDALYKSGQFNVKTQVKKSISVWLGEGYSTTQITFAITTVFSAWSGIFWSLMICI